MAPLATCIFVGVLAIFRFESARGAGISSDDDTGEKGAPPSPPLAAFQPSTPAEGLEGLGETTAGPSSPASEPSVTQSSITSSLADFLEEQFGFLTLDEGAASAGEEGEELSGTADDASSFYSEEPVAEPFPWLEGEFDFSDSDETRRASSPPSALSVAASAGPNLRLFPQCWEPEIQKRKDHGAVTEKCRVDVSVASPPSRHPFATVEITSTKGSLFDMHLPPWNALVSDARSTKRVSPILWQLEILHKYIHKESMNALRAAERLEPREENARSLLFHLLSVAEALLYAEGLRDRTAGSWYIELEAAVQVARRTIEDLLDTFEVIFQLGPSEAEGETGTAGMGESGLQTDSAKGDSPSVPDSGGGVKAGAEAAAGASGARGKPESRFQAAVERHFSTLKLRRWAKRMKVAAAEAGRRASDSLHRYSPLISEEQLLNLRLHTYRLLDLFEVRQQPLPVSRSITGYADPARLFRVDIVQAPTFPIPCKALTKRREVLIDILAELVESTLAVTTQEATRPSSISTFAKQLTRLSKSIRDLLRVKHMVPSVWNQAVQELLGHAYMRLELLLNQRPVFMLNLPWQ